MQAAGDGCSAVCQCESDPCRFTAGPQVDLASVVAGLGPGATLTLASGTYRGTGVCGWRLSSWGAVPITIRGVPASGARVVIDCDSTGPLVEGVIVGSHLRLEGIHVKGAYRSGSGGAVLRAEQGSSVEMVNCAVTGAVSDADGAVLVSSSSLIIRASHFEGNSAENGGSLAVVDGAQATFIDSTFTHCSAGTFGGACFISRASSCVVHNTHFSFNDAVTKGGSIFCGDGSALNISASLISNSSSARGGGVMVQMSSTARISHGSTFVGNEGAAWGGGMYLLLDARAEVDGTEGRIEFIENYGGGGGGIHTYLRNHLIIRGDVIVRGNFVRTDVAGIYVNAQTTAEFYPGLIFRDNWAAGAAAGGLGVNSASHVVAEGILVEDNTLAMEETEYGVGYGAGGVWVSNDCSLSLRNSIVRRNSARHGGGLSLSVKPHTLSLSPTRAHILKCV